jgi:hypothetical protein
MSLPDLSNWDDTKTALHQSMQVLRSTRLLGVNPLPSELEYSTIPTQTGATTGTLNFGGELRLDYLRAAVAYEKDEAEVFAVELNGHNQTSLFDAVFAAFAEAGLKLEPNRKKVTETTPFTIDLDKAKDYAALQWRMVNVLARVKAQMYGAQTPIALWPHGFDVSTLWFAQGMDEHKDPQLNMGFSPGTADVGQPYVYFYAWPVPDGLPDKLPANVTWNTSWSTPGGIIPYDQFANADDPESLLVATLVEVYHTASTLLKANLPD